MAQSNASGLKSFMISVPLAAVTSVGAIYLGKAAGTSPELAFLRWEGAGTIVINSLGVLAFWLAMMELLARSKTLGWQESAFQHKLLPEDAQTVIDKGYIPKIFEKLDGLNRTTRETVLSQAVELCATKYQVSTSVSEVAGTVEMYLQTESSRADSGYSFIRYLAWAIPSIGFIGTVMGLASALGRFSQTGSGGKEGQAAGVDQLIGQVSGDLMLAFNTTFVALSLAILLMYTYHKTYARQEGLFHRVSDYCLRFFVAKAWYPPRS